MQHPPAADPPPVTSTRRGLRLRYVNKGQQSFYEVEHPGELERLWDRLSGAEYDAGIALRKLWAGGAESRDDGLGLGPSRHATARL